MLFSVIIKSDGTKKFLICPEIFKLQKYIGYISKVIQEPFSFEQVLDTANWTPLLKKWAQRFFIEQLSQFKLILRLSIWISFPVDSFFCERNSFENFGEKSDFWMIS